MTETAGAEAWELVELASRDPEGAQQQAWALLDDPDHSDATMLAGARLALGLMLLYEGNPEAAEEHVVLARDFAERSGDRRLLGRALATYMGVAARTGRPELALRVAEEARSQVDGRELAHLMINRATVLAVGFGRPRDAIAAYDEVERSVTALPDDLRAILLMNRGTQHTRVGNLVAAQHDLAGAAATYERLGKTHARIDAALHLAIVAARRGDFATVFELYQSLVVDGTLTDNPHHYLDLSECLLAAGLVTEAQETCNRALLLTPDASTEAALLVRVMASETAMRAGRPAQATELARTARAAATELDHRSAMARADALLALAGRDGIDADAAERVAAALDDVGLVDDALRAALDVATRFFELGDGASVRNVLSNRVASDRSNAPARARLLHRRGLLAAASGDGAAARRLLSAGIADLERERATLAAPDLRAAASDRAPAMSQLGLRLAVEVGRPRPALEWAERVRATSLRLAAQSESFGAAEREQLDHLRRAAVGDRHRTDELEQRLTVRRRTQRFDGGVVRRRGADAICEQLGDDHVLLEYIELDGRLIVCRVDRGRASLIDIDLPVADVENTIGKMLFSLRRMATRRGAAAEAAAVMAAELGRRLGERLLPTRTSADEQIVIVPTGPLHHLPWSSIPQLADQVFVVAPSAHLWCEADDRGRWGDGILTTVGPNLRAAHDEATAVARAWGSRETPLRGTADLMRERLPGAAVAHFCCHGRFRTDSPQFSALELHDGPFTLFDLEGIEDLPPVVVLSACSLGSVDVHLGDDLLGFPAALFARGVAALIAAVLPVEDGATRDLMVDLHRDLAAGVGTAESLRNARVAAIERGGSHVAAAASFLCFGSG